VRVVEPAGAAVHLPTALAPWARELSALPLDLACVLGAWLPRLDQAIGPLRAVAGRPTDEPNGYDGLARRGTFERLLASEWAIGALHPLEFLRRAAEAEHAFLRVARATHVADRAVRVLFDAGPMQLGAPRLVHLAIGVVLARRARAARARFAWGTLQHEPKGFREDAHGIDLRALLDRRAASAATSSMMEEWRARRRREDRDSSLDPDAGELWLVGGHDLRHTEGGAGLGWIAVEEPLEVDAGFLRIALRRRPGGRASSAVFPLELVLPPSEERVLLLRGTFEARRRRSRPRAASDARLGVQPGSRLLVSHARVVAWSRAGGLVSFSLALNENHSAEARVSERDAAAISGLVAAGVGRGIVTVRLRGAEVLIEGGGKRTWRLSLSPDQQQALGIEPVVWDGVLPECVVLGGGSSFHAEIWFRDCGGGLFRARPGIEGAAALERIASGVTRLVQHRGDCVAYVAGDGAIHEHSLRQRDSTWSVPPGMRILFGHGPGERPLVASQLSAERWAIAEGAATFEMKLPGADYVCGIVGTRTGTGMLRLDDSRRRLTLHHLITGKRTPVFESREVIANVAVSATSPIVAWTTRSGRLHAYHAYKDAQVLDVSANGALSPALAALGFERA